MFFSYMVCKLVCKLAIIVLLSIFFNAMASGLQTMYEKNISLLYLYSVKYKVNINKIHWSLNIYQQRKMWYQYWSYQLLLLVYINKIPQVCAGTDKLFWLEWNMLESTTLKVSVTYFNFITEYHFSFQILITMGRPRKENPMTATEWSRNRRSAKKKREARQLKAQTNPLSEEELKKNREADRIRKAASRLNQSRQKKVGIKSKDRNRKHEQVGGDTEESSTKRVQKHRILKVKFELRSKKQKVNRVAKTLDISLSMLSPQSRAPKVYHKPQNPTCQKAYLRGHQIHW